MNECKPLACGTTLTLIEGLAKEHSRGKPRAVSEDDFRQF